MAKGRMLFVGTVVSAVVGLVTASRTAESRRAACERLRASLSRRGGVSAFAGTPCSREAALADRVQTPTRARDAVAPDTAHDGGRERK